MLVGLFLDWKKYFYQISIPRDPSKGNSLLSDRRQEGELYDLSPSLYMSFYSIFLNGMLYLSNLFLTNIWLKNSEKTRTMIVPWVDELCSHQLCVFGTDSKAHLTRNILSLLFDDNLETLEKHLLNVDIFLTLCDRNNTMPH